MRYAHPSPHLSLLSPEAYCPVAIPARITYLVTDCLPVRYSALQHCPAMQLIAWDIETCPFPEDSYSEAQQSRYEERLAKRRAKHPDEDPDDASRLVRSLHPFLSWICCISAVRSPLGDAPNRPKSWTAATPDDEAELLDRFWDDIKHITSNASSIRWVTFNGKQFDVPFVEARSVHHGVTPFGKQLLDTYPFNDAPHLDLMKLWPMPLRLHELCELVGVDSPKDEGDGSRVADLVADGQIEQVARYCEKDVMATLACAKKVWPLLQAR